MDTARTCPWCQQHTAPNDAFCSGCGAPALPVDSDEAVPDAAFRIAGSASTSEPTEAGGSTFHIVDLTGDAPQEAAGGTDQYRPWMFALLALFVGAAGALTTMTLLGDTQGSTESAETPQRSTAPLVADTSAPGVPSALTSTEALAIEPLAFELSWAEGSDLVRTTEDGTRVQVNVGAEIESGPVVLGDELVVAAGGAALALSASGSIRKLGGADLVVASGRVDTVWLGEVVREEAQSDQSPLLTPPAGLVRWLEVDADGTELRRATREPVLDFGTPDLVWGFQSTIYRLSDRARHPWRFIAAGFPVAVGPNDVILNVCTPDRTTCERRWFDAQSGEPKGALLDSIAANFQPHHGGRISPDGQWAVTDTTADGVQIHALATGELVDHACHSAEQLTWGPTGLLACHGLLGVTVYDLGTGRFEPVDGAPKHTELALSPPTS